MASNNRELRDLYRMGVFAWVARQGSFTLAARALGLGKSVVSHHVSRLEEDLGTRLLQRSTRSLRLTEEGQRYYEASRRVLETAEQARLALETSRAEVTGRVRLTASYNLGTTFLPGYLRRFHDRYPRIEVELALDDAFVDLIAEGYDLALRVSWGRQPNLIGRRLYRLRLVLCAAREYLKRRGAPTRPEDLAEHPWITVTRIPGSERLVLRHHDGRKVTVPIAPAIRTNTGIAARELVRTGLGLSAIPDFAIRGELASGELVELLPGWRAPGGVISAVYPHRQVSTRARNLVELLVEEFRKELGGVATEE